MKSKLSVWIVGLLACLLMGGLAVPADAASPAAPPKPVITVVEEEPAIPLSDLRKEQANTPTEDGTVPRMLGSLVVVILLLYGSLKYGLPKLVEHYPNLFQALEAKGDGSPLLSLENFQALKKAAVASGQPSAEAKFKVLTSKVIGVGRELHLVEIKGRQLVIASTAQQMTLLTQWDEEPSAGLEIEKASYHSQPAND